MMPTEVSRALLERAEELGTRVRTAQQAAQAAALEVLSDLFCDLSRNVPLFFGGAGCDLLYLGQAMGGKDLPEPFRDTTCYFYACPAIPLGIAEDNLRGTVFYVSLEWEGLLRLHTLSPNRLVAVPLQAVYDYLGFDQLFRMLTSGLHAPIRFGPILPILVVTGAPQLNSPHAPAPAA